MKIFLTLLICSATSGTCLPPYTYEKPYSSSYNCMVAGYNKALAKTIQIGRDNINEHKIFIKFICRGVFKLET
tara:strand:- start:243 stop:461 length:219 start_codon:yes stop_codon:yes gene_type:complete